MTLDVRSKLSCPECGSNRHYKDGLRYTNEGQIQRYLCRVCGYRFSESSVEVHVVGKVSESLHSGENYHEVRVASRDASDEKVDDDLSFFYGEDVGSHDISIAEKSLYDLPFHNSKRQLCVLEKAKKLDTATKTKNVAGEENQKLTVKGQLLQFALHCRNEGLTEETVRIWYNHLKRLNKKANLDEPESVKEYLSNTTYAQGTKYNIAVIYNAYLNFIGKTWKRPKYSIEEKLPEFIPTEQEIDALISGCGKKTATILRTIKETGMRIGEALRLKWAWLDTERNILTLNNPEKHGRPRAFKVSSKLVGMLTALPKKNELIFAGVKPTSAQNCFKHSRRRLATKLGNPRLAKIHFHLIRHWFGTMQYHKKPDLIHVQKLLGHRNILATQIYVNLEQALFQEGNDEYHVKVAETVEEATKLIAVGYEYVSTIDNQQIYRKRK